MRKNKIPLRVTIDARFYGLENAGLGRYTMNLVKHLQKIDTKNEYTLLLRKKHYTELKVVKNFKKVLVDIPHYSAAEQLKMTKVISATHPDIVHFLHFNVPVTYSGNFIVTIHDLLMHKSVGKDATTLPMFFYHLKRIGYKTVFRHAIMASKHVIVPSNFVKKELSDEYKINLQKISVVYEGVTTAKVKDTKSERKNPYFIYTGNAYPHKNLKRAISALLALNKEQNTHIDFIIVCSRSVFTKRLEVLIKSLDAQKYVHLAGFVNDEDLQTLYRNSLGFLYPSLSEGFGLPALEAMKSGTVALVSDIAVFNEIYGDKVIYFNPHKTASITKAMQKVISMDPVKRQDFIEKAKKHTEKYSWEKMADETLKIYNSFYDEVSL